MKSLDRPSSGARYPVTSVPHPDEIDAFLAAADQVAVDASGLVFATIHKGSAEIIGSTRFMHASPANRRVEIGYTFLAQSHQRTPINTAAKSLKPHGDAGWAYQRLNDLQHHRERMERSKKGP